MPSLFVIQGRDQGKRFDIDQPSLRLGRDQASEIRIQDTEVSRAHAEVVITGDDVELVDLESSNGTFVNSRRIERQLLHSGDRVQLGRTLMIFTGDDESSTGANLVTSVDIVAREHETDGSRIVSSISQASGSSLFEDPESSASPWLARARSNLQVMYRTALAVSHTLDIDQLLQRIMDLIFEWVEADRGVIMLVDQETQELMPKVRQNRKGIQDDEAMQISRTILDYVTDRGEGVLTSNAGDDDRWQPGVSIVNLGVREAICVPMQGRYGVVGVTYIDTYTPPGRNIHQSAANRFSDDHLKLMIAIGHQAALAIEDTSYYSAMVQAERLAAMGQTIAMLSHHVKNILQGIRGGSYLIEEGLKDDDHDIVRKGWAIVDKNQDKISNLVMDMLSFSKERQPEKIPASINQTVADVLELMQSRAGELGVALDSDLEREIPELMFDSESIHRAILNVVTNAIDACEKVDNARVTVGTQYCPQDHLVRITIDDNGHGIAEPDLKKVFSAFESTKGARGTGLGLPVSQKIMREHQGDIHVTSQIGQGSRFVLELPALVCEGPKGEDPDTMHDA